VWPFPETGHERCPCVNGHVGLSAPRARNVDRSPHHPPRAGASESETHLTAARLVQSQAPSLGFSQRPPLHRRRCWHPLPRAEARIGLTPPGAMLVPPSPFLTASTVSSTSSFAGLLHPASDREVHRVSTPWRRMPAIASALSRRCQPSRAFPFREAVPASPRGLAPLSFPGKRRRDFEALFRSEIRHSRGSWPNRTARCSPGLPHLEPHTGTVRTRADPVANPRPGATAARRPRPHQVGGGGRTGEHHCRARRCEQDRLCHHRNDVLAGLSPGRTVVLPSRSRGAPRVRRMLQRRAPPEGVCAAATSEVSKISWPRGVDRRSDRSRLLSRVP